jgi:hypothetical protein
VARAAVELDDKAGPGPEEVDQEPGDEHVDVGSRERGSTEEAGEPLFEPGA